MTLSASDSTTTSAADAQQSQGVSTSTVNGKPSVTITSQASFPTDLPSRIVPASESIDSGTALNAQAAQDNVATSTISILLDDSMPWSWVVDNSDASGQIFYYVPQIVSTALEISATEVETVALQAYQTTDSGDGSSDILTVFLGKIPANYVDALATMIKTPTSPVYNQSGLQGQMAQMFVSSFSVTSYANDDGSSSSDSAGGGGQGGDSGANALAKVAKEKSKSKKIIIAVVVTCGVLLLAIAAYFAFRATKRGAIALGGGGSQSPKFDFRDRDMGYRGEPGLRPFQLGGGAAGSYPRGGGVDRDSLSSTSTTSTRSSPPRRGGRGGFGHGASTSIDHHHSSSDRRSSWWRFSDGTASDERDGARRGSGGGGGGAIGLAIGGDGSGPMREGPRRTRIVNPAMIGR